MANRVMGEATVQVSDGRQLTLRFDFNAMCATEEASGRAIADVMNEIADAGRRGASQRVSTVRALVYGGLSFHHPDLTLADVGDLVVTDGAALMQGMEKAVSAANAGQEGRQGENPPGAKTAPRGTGSRSSRNGQRRG